MRAVVLALTVAIVASQQINLVPEFARDNTYVYKYEALLLSGLPQKGLARAGIKLKSKVQIHAVTENNFLMKFTDPQLYEYAGIWPKDQFFPANKLTSALAAQLQIPIKFEYSNGVVGKVFAPSRVSPTALNLYRGILNILQLNLKKTQNIYELQESGSQGVCKTHYVISEDPRSNHIIVTKSKDLSHCQERITKEVGLAYTEKCYECTKKVKSLIETASYNYIMKPAASGVLITEATVEEVHQFSPFNEIHGAVQMEANQTFSFVEIERKPIVPINADYLARGSLHYEFSNEILQNPIQLLKINNAPAQITEVLKHLVANNEATVHDDAPLKFLELIQLLQHTTLQSIQTIWAQFKHKPVYRRWLLDSLPAVGTHAVVKLIKEKFLSDELTVPEFIQAFAGALQRVTADLDTIQLTASLAMKEKITSNPAVRKVVMLGYGSLIAKYCVSHPNCPAELLRPIHEVIAEATSKNDIPEITLALKAMGNAGQPASLKPIMKLLPGLRTAATSLPIKVQVDAILAMQNIAKKDPKLVQPVAMQLLLDRALHPEVRMVACIVLFEAKPSVALVSNLAGALKMETNMHVASFVYSHIKSLTRNTSPDMASVAGAANVAIKLMSRKLDRLSFRFSRALQLEFYNTNLMIGATGSAYMINDAATILPRAFIAKARGYLAGNVADVLEIGLRTEGIQEVLKQSYAADESTERITKFKRTLRALANWKNLPNYHSWASAYVKVLGQEVAYLNINKTTIEEAVQNVTGHKPHGLLKYALKALQEGISFQYSKPLLASEVRRIVPTAVGFPMELSLYTTAVASGNLNVQATITPFPTETDSMTFEQLKKTDVQFQAEATPSVALHTFATMGVNTALIQAAVMAKGKIRTIAPVKVSARADIFKGNYKVEALPVEVPEHIAAVSFETVAVVRNIEEPSAPRIVPLVPEFGMQNDQTPANYWSSERADETPVRAAAPYHKTLCHAFRFIETKGCIEVQSQSASSISNATVFYIIGQHSARATVKRAEGPAVERLELEVHVGPKAAEKLLKKINLIDEESPEGRAFMLKLRQILENEDGNGYSSSESSSSSQSSSRNNRYNRKKYNNRNGYSSSSSQNDRYNRNGYSSHSPNNWYKHRNGSQYYRNDRSSSSSSSSSSSQNYRYKSNNRNVYSSKSPNNWNGNNNRYNGNGYSSNRPNNWYKHSNGSQYYRNDRSSSSSSQNDRYNRNGYSSNSPNNWYKHSNRSQYYRNDRSSSSSSQNDRYDRYNRNGYSSNSPNNWNGNDNRYNRNGYSSNSPNNWNGNDNRYNRNGYSSNSPNNWYKHSNGSQYYRNDRSSSSSRKNDRYNRYNHNNRNVYSRKSPNNWNGNNNSYKGNNGNGYSSNSPNNLYKHSNGSQYYRNDRSSSSSSSSSQNDRYNLKGYNNRNGQSSSSSSRMTENVYDRESFRKFHKNQFMGHHGASEGVSSGSSGSSFEQIQKQTKYLGNSVQPVFAVIARTVRDDHKMLGYQLAAFFDKPSARVQLIVSSIAENDNWKFCADGVKLSKHKVTTKVAWGPECQKYKVLTKAETGMFGEFPAVRLELEYERLPVNPITYAKKLSKYIPMAAVQAGFSYEKSRNCQKEIELTLSFPTKRTMNIIVRSPEMTLSRKIIPLPMAVPFNQDGTFSTHNDQDISFNPQNYMHD